MPDPFASLIADARAFLGDLTANNNRDWFMAHKEQYEANLKSPALALLDVMTADLGPATGTKLFRPHRDVRFSKDKTPYHTHLHMMWKLPGGALKPGLFLGIAPDYVTIGCGVMGFDKPGLEIWRNAVAKEGQPLADMLERLQHAGMRLDAPELKRVPAPFDKDHPQGSLLKRKSLTLWHDPAPESWSSPSGAIRQVHQNMHPVLDWLRSQD